MTLVGIYYWNYNIVNPNYTDNAFIDKEVYECSPSFYGIAVMKTIYHQNLEVVYDGLEVVQSEGV